MPSDLPPAALVTPAGAVSPVAVGRGWLLRRVSDRLELIRHDMPTVVARLDRRTITIRGTIRQVARMDGGGTLSVEAEHGRCRLDDTGASFSHFAYVTVANERLRGCYVAAPAGDTRHRRDD